jgi:hypothetical protein
LQRTIGNQAMQRMLPPSSRSPQPPGVQAGGLEQAAVPLVRDVLAGPGKPLDASTGAFMQRRFGRDFGDVRVHTGTKAAESARAMEALAYTSGHQIVFGAGQYAPHTEAGQRLLAHELTHVVQQAPPQTIRRQPTRDKGEKQQDARLQQLAEDPAAAHTAWPRLNEVDRTSVAIRMSALYGPEFAKSFVWYTKNPSKRRLESEISDLPYRTPDWYKARGYLFRMRSQGAVRGQFLDFWIHPSGRVVGQLVDKTAGVPQQPQTTQPPTKQEPPIVDCKEMVDLIVSMLDSAIDGESEVQKDLEKEKSALEKLNKTYDSYCRRFDKYMAALKEMSARVESEVNDIELLRDQLVEAKCSIPADIDIKLDVLRDFVIWADIESSPMTTQFLECIKLPEPIDVPGEDDEES